MESLLRKAMDQGAAAMGLWQRLYASATPNNLPARFLELFWNTVLIESCACDSKSRMISCLPAFLNGACEHPNQNRRGSEPRSVRKCPISGCLASIRHAA